MCRFHVFNRLDGNPFPHAIKAERAAACAILKDCTTTLKQHRLLSCPQLLTEHEKAVLNCTLETKTAYRNAQADAFEHTDGNIGEKGKHVCSRMVM